MSFFRTISVLALAALTAGAAGCGKNSEDMTPAGEHLTKDSQTTEIIVLAAASLSDAFSELKEKFENSHPGVKVLYSFGGSGALQAQIEAGAKADVFVSASLKQMNALREKNLMNDRTIRNFLENKIVLVVDGESHADVSSFYDLASDKIKRLALGEFSSVPAGMYAKEILISLGILDTALPKAVFGSDVRAVLAWVESGDADAGIVYATDAMSSQKVKIAAAAPEGSCAKVIYPAGMIKDSAHAKDSLQFLEYLFASDAQKIFKKYGFDVLSAEGNN